MEIVYFILFFIVIIIGYRRRMRIVRIVLFCFFFFVRFSFVRYREALGNGRRSRSTNDRIVSASHIAVVFRVGSVPYTATGYPYRINIGLPRNTRLEKFCRTRFTNVSTSTSPVLEYD